MRFALKSEEVRFDIRTQHLQSLSYFRMHILEFYLVGVRYLPNVKPGLGRSNWWAEKWRNRLMLVDDDSYDFYLQFAPGMKPKFEEMVVVDFFWWKIRSKSQLIKNQYNIKNAYSLSLNFFGPRLTLTG